MRCGCAGKSEFNCSSAYKKSTPSTYQFTSNRNPAFVPLPIRIGSLLGCSAVWSEKWQTQVNRKSHFICKIRRAEENKSIIRWFAVSSKYIAASSSSSFYHNYRSKQLVSAHTTHTSQLSGFFDVELWLFFFPFHCMCVRDFRCSFIYTYILAISIAAIDSRYAPVSG